MQRRTSWPKRSYEARHWVPLVSSWVIPAEAASMLTVASERAENAEIRYALLLGLAAAAGRLDAVEAAKICRRAAHGLIAEASLRAHAQTKPHSTAIVPETSVEGSGTADPKIAWKVPPGVFRRVVRTRSPALVVIVCGPVPTEKFPLSGPIAVVSPYVPNAEFCTLARSTTGLAIVPDVRPAASTFVLVLTKVNVGPVNVALPIPVMSIVADESLTASTPGEPDTFMTLFVSAVAVNVRSAFVNAVPPSDPDAVAVSM